ncbi:hypothetical protein AURANDRAFT_67506 [Aureococcus anophagefferens]|uniref:Uncharacterized protein n=1 Tax=Aureococcus anophagefferens TaxID=44056 RepID=F0YLD9_AURAN|nr:hypothetical protein AURANDRAFT_67506 [Aureococcus anophagefferens]EGB04101.1 hypothetical protein AURANDRAFT_67506 [Aureococcus anophagefferens]|eukprot:XP_009041226.1 hypothetical protein AURANDRAFT_67506 [Aureococcus anophagefferens]
MKKARKAALDATLRREIEESKPQSIRGCLRHDKAHELLRDVYHLGERKSRTSLINSAMDRLKKRGVTRDVTTTASEALRLEESNSAPVAGALASQGDFVAVELNGYKAPVNALVVREDAKEVVVEFEADRVRAVYDRDSQDIVALTKTEQKQSEELRHVHERAQHLVEYFDERLSGGKRKKAGVSVFPPQVGRDKLPNPADAPRLYKYIVIEVGSGSAALAQAIFIKGNGLIGVYTIDWDDRRFAHLKEDLRNLDFSKLLTMFPQLIHVHCTWDCKANSPAGQQQHPVTYGKKAKAKGLKPDKARIVHIAEGCATMWKKAINDTRRLSPFVTFSWEHPTGVVSMCKLCGTKFEKTLEILTDIADFPEDDYFCTPCSPCKWIENQPTNKHPERLEYATETATYEPGFCDFLGDAILKHHNIPISTQKPPSDRVRRASRGHAPKARATRLAFRRQRAAGESSINAVPYIYRFVFFLQLYILHRYDIYEDARPSF